MAEVTPLNNNHFLNEAILQVCCPLEKNASCVNTPLKFNIAPEKLPSQYNRKVVFK